MRIKTIIDEDFNNYKLPSMFIGTCFCDWKCAKEGGFDTSLCQNSPLANDDTIYTFNDILVKRYMNNNITKAIVLGGLEPMLQFQEIYDFIKFFRNYSNDDVVIYTGYYPNEIQEEIKQLKQFENITVKYGRYIPNQEKHYDEILGVYLASDNQYAEKIS